MKKNNQSCKILKSQEKISLSNKEKRNYKSNIRDKIDQDQANDKYPKLN